MYIIRCKMSVTLRMKAWYCDGCWRTTRFRRSYIPHFEYHCRKLAVFSCLSQVVTGCPATHMGEQLNTEQLAAKATRRVSVGRMNQNDAPYTRISYNCSFCTLTFKWKHTLNDHISAVLEGKRFACTQCRCTFVSRGGLNEHVKHLHQQLPRYKCEQCGKGYANRTHLLRHIFSHGGIEWNAWTIYNIIICCMREPVHFVYASRMFFDLS